MKSKSPSPNDNTFDMIHRAGEGNRTKPETPAQYNHFPRATFAQEVASELGMDTNRLAALAGPERAQVNAMEEKTHFRGSR